MIRFRCHCGRLLEAPLSEAGGAVQCPQCGRLRSVPGLDELAGMEEDGTIRLAGEGGAEMNVQTDPRLPPRHGERHGGGEMDVERPKYDPETGERIVAMELVDEPAITKPVTPPQSATLNYATPATRSAQPAPVQGWMPQVIAPAAPQYAEPLEAAAVSPSPSPAAPPIPRVPRSPHGPRTLSYAQGRYNRRGGPIPLEHRPVFWYSIPLELFQPQNVLVLGIVLGVHLAVQFFWLLTALRVLPAALFIFLTWLLLLAHYGNTLEETSIDGRDEIPAVLRNVSFMDDIVRPLWYLFGALVLCFGPAAALARAMDWSHFAHTPTVLAMVAALVVGWGLFPAVWLTLATSGSIWNLAPHRVGGVIARAGWKYLIAVVALPITVACYLAGLTGLVNGTVWLTQLGPGGTIVGPLVSGAIGLTVLGLGVYLAHGFCWLLGQIYQAHHDEFPWVLQRHISTRTDPIKQLERRKMEQLQAQREAHAKRASEQVRSRLATRP